MLQELNQILDYDDDISSRIYFFTYHASGCDLGRVNPYGFGRVPGRGCELDSDF